MKPALKILRNRFQSLYSRKSQRQLTKKLISSRVGNLVSAFLEAIYRLIRISHESTSVLTSGFNN